MSPITLMASTLALVLMFSLLASANAQMPEDAIGGGDGGPIPQSKEIAGKYSNSKFGLEFVIPQGYVGQEISLDKNMLAIFITSKTAPNHAQGSPNSEIQSGMSILVTKLDKQSTNMKASPVPPEGDGPQCKDSKLPNASIDGKQFTSTSTECTFGGQKMQTRNFSADLNGLQYTLSDGNGFAKFDEIVKTIKINKADSANDVKKGKDTKKEIKKDVKKGKDTKKEIKKTYKKQPVKKT